MTAATRKRLRHGFLGLLALVLPVFLAVQPGLSQTKSAADQTTEVVRPADPEAGTLDYAAWAEMATRAEAAIADRNADSRNLQPIRTQLVDWRGAFLGAQSANATRIATLRAQIAALGAPPADGIIEPVDIASRRTELAEQLVRLQAPGIAADEAYSRADGLIREIDRLLRERQADELLRLMPAPINPANWPDAVRAVTSAAVGLWGEVTRQWREPAARGQFGDNLPLIALLLAVAAVLLWRGRDWIERLALRLQAQASVRARRIWWLVTSLGQIAVPSLGVYALAVALRLTGMLGPIGTSIVNSLPGIGLTFFVTLWLGIMVFPVVPASDAMLRLSDNNRARGRFATAVFGLGLALDMLRQAVFAPIATTDAAQSVLRFPLLLVGGLLLLRLGHILRRHRPVEAGAEDTPAFRNRVIGWLARGAVLIGVLGPLLAAVGYLAAGAALIFPAGLTLALVAVLFIVQRLVEDVFALVMRRQETAGAALWPVLVSAALAVATLPIFALIWGAQSQDLSELWTRFREGFQLGSARVSPTDFLFFAVIFGLGYMLTRLFQGALKSSILPQTSLDQGGQNAIAAGVGYTGLFLSGLVAIKSTGIDLSGLAIVAGALSLGIGFGLQNIVSNFVSGIILLIERPVSEGDWIEVGNVQGIVRAISVRSTRIQTFDRTDVIVPNTDLVAGRVTNWTRFNLTGRLIVPVGVVFDSDTRMVERILQEIAEAQPMAILNPPPVVAFMGFGPDAMLFEIRVILRDINFNLPVRSEINHQIVERLTAAGIGLAHASREVTHKFAAERAQVADAAALAPVLVARPAKEASE